VSLLRIAAFAAAGRGGPQYEILGRPYVTTGDEVLESTGVDVELGTSTAEAHSEVYLWATATDVEIRIEGSAGGSNTEECEWFDENGVSQGTTSPLSATTIFKYGSRTGVTVNIYTSNSGLPSDGCSRVKRGTFTDDDKSTFFNPTNSTKYGYQLDCEARDPPNGSPQSGGTIMQIQFTFKKAGASDYTITFSVQVAASANDAS
jgi:hypothetical protein